VTAARRRNGGAASGPYQKTVTGAGPPAQFVRTRGSAGGNDGKDCDSAASSILTFPRAREWRSRPLMPLESATAEKPA